MIQNNKSGVLAVPGLMLKMSYYLIQSSHQPSDVSIIILFFTDEKMSSKAQAWHWDLVELTSTMSTASQIHQYTTTNMFFSSDI